MGVAMGRAGVRRVRTHFSWDEVAQRLVRVYERVRRTRATVLQTPLPVVEALVQGAGVRMLR